MLPTTKEIVKDTVINISLYEKVLNFLSTHKSKQFTDEDIVSLEAIAERQTNTWYYLKLNNLINIIKFVTDRIPTRTTEISDLKYYGMFPNID